MATFGVAGFSCKAFNDGLTEYGYWGRYDRRYDDDYRRYYSDGCQGTSTCALLLLPKERRQFVNCLFGLFFRIDLIW
jgi:hypothetical protein